MKMKIKQTKTEKPITEDTVWSLPNLAFGCEDKTVLQREMRKILSEGPDIAKNAHISPVSDEQN